MIFKLLYKLQADSDEDGFIHKYDCIPTNKHDSKQFKSLLSREEKQIHADTAYKSGANDQYQFIQGTGNQIHDSAYCNKSLMTKDQKRANTWSS